MDQGQTSIRASDAIDSFASDILRHPHRAEMLKARLRKTLGVAAANKTPLRLIPPADTPADAEDFWDNVPI